MLLSGQVTPSDTGKPANSRSFGKPLSVDKMIAELQAMVGMGRAENGSARSGSAVDTRWPGRSHLAIDNDQPLRLTWAEQGAPRSPNATQFRVPSGMIAMLI